jgi:hypothetical protein
VPSTTHSSTRWTLWTARLVPPLLFLLAAAYNYSHFLGNPRHALIGGADGVAYAWYLEWVQQAIIHGHNPFVSAALNAPTGVNLMWNTSIILLGFITFPVVAVIGPFITVGILFTLAPFLSATSAYFVFRRITGGVIGSALGAALFGFSPFFVGHWGHINLILAPALPLLLLVCHNLFVTQTRSPIQTGIVLGLLVGLQFLLSEELVVLSIAAAIPMLVFLAALNPRAVRGRIRHAATALGIGVLVALVLTSVPLGYQLFGPVALTNGVTSSQSKADIASLVRPSLLQHFASLADRRANLHFPANGAENTAFLGWPLIIACLVLCAWLIIHRDRFGVWWLLSTAAVVSLSFGTIMQVNGHAIGHGPWNVYRIVPYLNGTQVVRFSVITALMIGFLIAHTLGGLELRWQLVTAVALTAAMIPLWPNVPFRSGRVADTPRFFTTSAVNAIPAHATAMVLPVARFPRVDAMQWQIRSHMRFNMVGGYSVFKNGARSTFFPPLPRAWSLLGRVSTNGAHLTDQEVVAAQQSLRDYRISVIVVTREMHNFDQVSAEVGRIGDCVVRPVADVNLCTVNL